MSTEKIKNTASVPAPESFGLPCTGVETHAHVNGKYFNEDREEMLARAKAAGLARIGNVFMGSEAYYNTKQHFDNHPEVFFILGVHPTDAQNLDSDELEKIRQAAKENPRIKAIGETGLDYYWKNCPPAVQKKAFIAQLNLAQELQLPIVIHSRDSMPDTVEILLAEGFKDYPVLWHCFGGDSVAAKLLVNNGWYVSIPGIVTYPANNALREALCHIPLTRLMLETDCPYLTPVPFRGKRNEPAYLAYTIQSMAQALNLNAAELWTACGKAALDFFRLEPL